MGDRSVPGSMGSIEIVDTRSGTYVGSITVDDNDPSGLALHPGTSKQLNRLFVELGTIPARPASLRGLCYASQRWVYVENAVGRNTSNTIFTGSFSVN